MQNKKEVYLEIPEQPTFQELELDPFGQNHLVFVGAEVNKKSQVMNVDAVPPNFMQSGDMTQRINIASDGFVQSENYVQGVSGWRLNADGTREFN